MDVISVTEDSYASWNIDASCNRGFHHINFTNPNLLAAARGLRPSKLRFGGSGNDNLVYGLTEGSPECSEIPKPVTCESPGYVNPGCLNSTHWQNLYDFGNASEADFIFGVAYGLMQACQEGASYAWNSTNAASLIQHIKANDQEMWGFELGNEVNNNGPGTACQQVPRQQAEALLHFAQMIRERLPGTHLIGPDTGGRDPLPWLQDYLPRVKDAGIHAVTHHVYPGVSRENYNSSAFLDRTLPEISWYTETLRKLAPDSQIWAGENGPTGGGPTGNCGVRSACGLYFTTLPYADDLGQRAKHGFVQYQRQDLFGGSYGLVNSLSTEQALTASDAVVLRPDYWINFMWKRCIGQRVLNATSTNPDVRVYAFAGKPPSPFAAPECKTASIQFLLINLSPSSVHGNTFPSILSTNRTTCSAWSLAPTEAGPDSEKAELNSYALPTTVDVSSEHPSFLEEIPAPAVIKPARDGIDLPPLSTTFACLH